MMETFAKLSFPLFHKRFHVFSEIQCEKPAMPNGKVTNAQPVYKWDDVLRYTCDEGYKAREGRTKCSKLGWNPKPECEGEEVFESPTRTDVFAREYCFSVCQ